ncbi:AraC family transcriptional regulator [Paenibacillus sp. 598K]|uniref:AraC family transcriptional regulator n=1 Tax=Paenibacillus sp. 598K TaxID=1117987 RepID=UPI000FFA2782|nr:AraC family transcriptional regulator [Paenibacillus sp. 598K]GBF72243.1 AraC family transcriptional regulator [Paenibacillus sp. 598K]
MKLNYFKSRLFLRYMSSYLLILLIPLICLTLLIYRNAVTNLRAEIEQSHLNQLTQAETIVNSHMKQLGNISSYAAYDERLARYRVNDPYFVLDANEALKLYKATSPIIEEMYLYYRGDTKIFSTEGMNSLEVFAETFKFRNWSADAIVGDLNGLQHATMRPADLFNRKPGFDQSMLAYLMPITPNSPTPHGTLMYVIRESELTGLIDTILGNYQGSSYIVSPEGQILASKSNREAPLTADELQGLVGLTPGIHNLKLSGVDHSVVSVRSSQNGWQYVTLMPSAQFFGNVLHIRSVIILLFSAVVVLGGVFALLLARRQYHPIFSLLEYANTRFKAEQPTSDAPAPGNELERIRSALEEYGDRVDLQEPYARNHLLLMLLRHGNVSRLPAKLLQTLDLSFERSRHFVMLIGRKDGDAAPEPAIEWQTMQQLLFEVEFPEYEARIYSVELPRPDQIALIASFNALPGMEEQRQLHGIVQAAHDHLHDIYQLHPVIGVGACYDSPDRLNQSFIEACSAYETRLAPGGTISYFSKLSASGDEACWLPKNVLLTLDQSLKLGNREVAEQTVREAVDYLQQPGLSVKFVRYMSLDLINTIVKTALEAGVAHVGAKLPAPDSFASLDELYRHCLQLVGHVCDQVEWKEEKEAHSLMDQIITYIDEHYMDHTLSLEEISYKYSISMSYFSRSFKETVGINFVQYIWKKRMAAVITDLTTTSDPLKDIIQRVGYHDAPSFIRRFKKETGHTPIQYRKLFSGGEG